MRREQLTGLLANARRAFKERLTRLATNEERTYCCARLKLQLLYGAWTR